MKLINGQLDEIMAKKGCDASNMFDEEVAPTEQEFSDDDDEKIQKRNRKLQNQKRKRNATGEASEDGELEDGELPSAPGSRGGRGAH